MFRKHGLKTLKRQMRKYSFQGTLRYCCKLSFGVALNVWFTTNGMCAKNTTIYMLCEQAVREIVAWKLWWYQHVNDWTCNDWRTRRVIAVRDLYCCWLQKCEALRTCCSGFPIATIWIVASCYFRHFEQRRETALIWYKSCPDGWWCRILPDFKIKLKVYAVSSCNHS